MFKRNVILTAAILSVGGIGLAATPAWAQAQADPQAQQQPAAADKSAAGQAAQAADNQRGAAQASEADARQALSQIANAALSKDPLQSISQQLCQKSQQKIGDLSQQADENKQIDQAADQLKTAYKDKFQQDLDLSKSPETVFTAQFFQIGGMGDQARQASERQAPDSSAGPSASGATSPHSQPGGADNKAASGDTTGAPAYNKTADSSPNNASDRAQTAGDSMMQRTMVVIPASQDLPETRVALVKEGNQWKVALPKDEDGKQLAQKLQQHIQEAAQQKDKWGSNADEAQRAIAHHVLMAFSHSGSSDATGNTPTKSIPQ